MKEVKVTISVPELIYEIYAGAAKNLGSCSVEQLMAAALHMYTYDIVQDMRECGGLPDD